MNYQIFKNSEIMIFPYILKYLVNLSNISTIDFFKIFSITALNLPIFKISCISAYTFTNYYKIFG